MTTFQTELRAAAATIGAWFTEIYDDLATMSESCGRELQGARGGKLEIMEKNLRAIRPAVETFLARHSLLEAAGIVIAPGMAGTELGSIEWWRRDAAGLTNRIVFNLSPDFAGFYDFVTLDWYADVVATGRPAIQGPYLDYAGLDQYILTCMVPLSVNGTLIGTAGCDIEVSALETVVMPILRTIPTDAALVSKMTRVVAGNSGRFLVGNPVTELPAGGEQVELPGVDLGLHLIASPKNNL